MHIYENLTDPVQCYKVAVKVLTIMKQVPLLDMNSFNFESSYQLSTQEMKMHAQVISKLNTFQQIEEENEIKRVYQKVNLLG
jgi:hypothetical protein